MAGTNLLVPASIAPQVLVSQALGATEVALYTVPAGASARLTQGSLCNTSATLTNTLTLGATSTTGGTLAAGATYWVVTAVNAAGESLRSNEVTATLTGATSSQPLSWTAVPGATSYNIYRGTTPAGENVRYNTGALTFTDTGAAGTAASPPAASTYGTAIAVSLSVFKSGGVLTDGTHRVINAYSLGVNDSLALRDYITDTMLGPGDAVTGFAGLAGAVTVVLSGTVHT